MRRKRWIAVVSLALGIGGGLALGPVVGGVNRAEAKGGTRQYTCLRSSAFIETYIRIHNLETKEAHVTIDYDGHSVHEATIAPRGTFDQYVSKNLGANVVNVKSDQTLLLDGVTWYSQTAPYHELQIRCT